MTTTRKTPLLTGLLCGLGLLTLGAGDARASFLPVFQGTTAGPAGPPAQTVFNYRLDFSTSIDGGTGQPVERLEGAGVNQGFVTLYDIVGLVPGSVVVPANFTFTVQNTGINAFATAPSDDPLLPNITFRYTGATISADTSFSGFSYNSTSNIAALDNTTGQTTRNTGAAAGTPIGNVGFVEVAAVPEPASIALMGLGGVILLGVARRRRAKA
jgi:hypothetical protein